jgi:hypothetical protein
MAILWRGKGWDWLVAAALALLAAVAHPLGLAWLLVTTAYVLIAEFAPGWRYQLLLFAAAVSALFAFHLYLWRHYSVYQGTGPAYFFNGADQLLLFGSRYRIPEYALVAFALVSLTLDCIHRGRQSGVSNYYAIPLQLYVLVEISVRLLPGGIHFPPPEAALALLTERLTSVSAALACCVLGGMQPRKWHLAALAAIAAVFFSFLYQDTAKVNQMEQQIVRLVSMLPPNQRVMATILPPDDSRIMVQHIVDLACIGRCFSYGNYEPSTGLFRIRALPGNPYVLSDYQRVVEMEDGEYMVQPKDLPVYQVYQCSPRGTDLCIHPLEAGEENDSRGVHPDGDR